MVNTKFPQAPISGDITRQVVVQKDQRTRRVRSRDQSELGQESYPDTGESGETYDVEICVTRKGELAASQLSNASHYCDLCLYVASPYNQWDD